MKLKLEATNRGFARVDFKDSKGHNASLQKSSLATEEAIWLGLDEGTHFEGQCYARMHLNQEQVKALLPLLERFVRTGNLWPWKRNKVKS